jgi:typhoid toxin secretion A
MLSLKAFAETIQYEGIYSNRLDDGETVYGIARNYWPKERNIWETVDKLKMRMSTQDMVVELDRLFRQEDEWFRDSIYEFYDRNFWDYINLDSVADISEEIAAYVFDTGVNMGAVTAAMMLQQTLNYLNRNERFYMDLVVDGKIGPRTLDSLKVSFKLDNDLVLKVLTMVRGREYLDLFEKKKSNEVNVGWLRRV